MAAAKVSSFSQPDLLDALRDLAQGHRREVFRIAHEMAARVGCVGVVVDAKPEAVAFYERYGFEAMDVVQGRLGDRPEPVPMFLALGEIPREG